MPLRPYRPTPLFLALAFALGCERPAPSVSRAVSPDAAIRASPAPDAGPPRIPDLPRSPSAGLPFAWIPAGITVEPQRRGAFCVSAPNDRLGTRAPPPYGECPARAEAPSRFREIPFVHRRNFSPELTARERSTRRDACCYTWTGYGR